MPNGEFRPDRKVVRTSGRSVVVGVAHQGDAVGRGHGGAGPAHDDLLEPALDALAVLGLGRGVGLGDQHVAVGQHVEPAGMIQAADQGGGDEARARRPASGRRPSRRPARSSSPGSSASWRRAGRGWGRSPVRAAGRGRRRRPTAAARRDPGSAGRDGFGHRDRPSLVASRLNARLRLGLRLGQLRPARARPASGGRSRDRAGRPGSPPPCRP
jgi:hypothetical protein